MSSTDTAAGEVVLKKKMGMGIAGMILGLIGMFCSIGGPHIVENVYPPQPFDAEATAEAAAGFIADVATKTGKKLVKGAADKARSLVSRDKKSTPGEAAAAPLPQPAKVEPAPEAEKEPPKPTLKQSRTRMASTFTGAGVVCGILAMFSGLMGWVRGGDHRAAAAAGIMGFVALAWVQIAIAMGVAIIAYLIAKFGL